jgi:putative intracellular protease/amidase
MRVAVVVFEGFDELDAIGPLEVLRIAAAMDATGLSVELVALDGAAEVTGSHGLRVRTDGRLDPEGTDLLVIPGGGWNGRGRSLVHLPGVSRQTAGTPDLVPTGPPPAALAP